MKVIEAESPSDLAVRKRSIEHYQKFATALDSQFVIPGTSIQFGIDSIVGLFPGVGDLLGLIFSLYIVYGAARLGVRTTTLLLMIFNIGADFLIGVVPLLGDILDVFSKSNLRNVKILRNYNFQGSENPRTPGSVKRVATLIVLAASAFLFAFGAAVVWAIGVLFSILTRSNTF